MTASSLNEVQFPKELQPCVLRRRVGHRRGLNEVQFPKELQPASSCPMCSVFSRLNEVQFPKELQHDDYVIGIGVGSPQ